MKAVVSRWWDRARKAVVELGPLAIVALLLPGGSILLALALIYRQLQSARARS